MSRNASSQNKIGSLAFSSTWRTTNTSTGSSASNQVTLPLISTGKYNFTVNWGDGTSNLITAYNQAEVTHTYAATGDYGIDITGTLIGWQFDNNGDRLKLIKIKRWGALKFLDIDTSLSGTKGAFFGCANLDLSSIQDTPNFKNLKQATSFLRVTSANTTVTIDKVNKWDVSKVQVFTTFFREMNNFNDNVGNWNMSSAISLLSMFGATVNFGTFNNGGSNTIKNWDVSNVRNFASMFYNQRDFNQEVGLWNVGNGTDFNYMFGIGINTTVNNYGVFTNAGSNSIGNWNMSNAWSTYAMFYSQKLFDVDLGRWDMSKNEQLSYMFATPYLVGSVFNNGGSPSIGNWNTSKNIYFNFMFSAATKFNQNIGNWNVEKGQLFTYMLGSSTPMSPPMEFNNGGSSDIQKWRPLSATDMGNMFRNNPAFNQPLGNWNVSGVTVFTNFLQNSSVNTANYNNLLLGWASRPVKPNISVNMGSVQYSAVAAGARSVLTSAPNNWTITDGGII
jgi:hypothetical protein